MSAWDEIANERDQEHERREAGLCILDNPNGGRHTFCDKKLTVNDDVWDVSDLINDIDDEHLPVQVCPECCAELEILLFRFLVPKESK